MMSKFQVAFAMSLLGCASEAQVGKDSVEQSIVSGAAFTTFDAQQGGCRNSKNGVNCNQYEDKGDVYASGGPNNPAALSDGDYFFAVLTPGSQNGGFLDGASGNLSDTTAGGTAGDAGTGDAVSNRTFSVADHKVSAYAGTHATGTSPNGQSIIQLAPYDDTDNAGGVYILAICKVGTTSPSDCKFDAFRVVGDTVDPPEFPIITGAKYYDANANGRRDDGEATIPNWPIDFHDGVSATVTTCSVAGNGCTEVGGFAIEVVADTYNFAEKHPTNLVTLKNGATTPAWQQTGNTLDQTTASGGATATLNIDKTYDVTVIDNSRVDGLYFGNLCLGKGGGLTLGFWSNKNGQALIIGSGGADFALLSSLNLRNANGTNYDPAGYNSFRTWILSATATNMAYMLSAQLAAMELNVAHGFVNPNALIYAPGTSLTSNDFASVAAVMQAANESLGVYGSTAAISPQRAAQEALKNALDNANNNLNFVQASAASCPAPVF